MVHFIFIYASISSPLPHFYRFFNQLNFDIPLRTGKKKIMMMVLPMSRTPYHLVVCQGAVDFVAWSASVDGRQKPQYPGHKECPITCTTVILSASPSCTSNQLHCHETTLLIAFHLQCSKFHFLLWYYIHYGLQQIGTGGNERAHYMLLSY